MADQKLPNENEIVTDADFSFVQKDGLSRARGQPLGSPEGVIPQNVE